MILFSALLGVISFLLLCTILRRRISAQQKSTPNTFDVFVKEHKKVAVNSSPNFNWVIGLLYSAFFYFALPVLIWRYGKALAIFLIIAPMVIAFGIAFGINTIPNRPIPLLGFYLISVIRAGFGFHLASNDSIYRRAALCSRGWTNLGLRQAKSSKMAIQKMAGISQVKTSPNI